MTEVNKKITPEIQVALDKLRGYTPQATFFFTPPLIKEHIPKEKWPVFKLSSRSGEDHVFAEDSITFTSLPGGKVKANSGHLRIQVLAKNVLGFKNYINRDGKEIVCEYNEDKSVKLDSIYDIAIDMQDLLLRAINDESKLNAEELEGLKF